ncbi:hypothetical protein vseg_019931 [Gypsophila vaccaria]
MSSLLHHLTTTTVLLLVLLFLAPSTATADNLVVDKEGHPLVAGQYYHAMPIATQKGGGLTMFNNGPTMCPNFIVARSTKETDLGIPIKFSPQTQGPNKNNIYTSSNLSIAFKFLSPQPLCRRRYTTVWAVATDKAVVVLDGEEGSDDSLFKLEEYGGGYKILTKDNKTLLYKKHGYGEVLLGFDSGNPLFVVFVKA